MTVWDQINDLLKEGKDPKVNLSFSSLKIPERRKPGRPKKPKRELTDLEKIANKLLVHDRVRPRCANPLCNIRLRVRSKVVCSDACKDRAIMYYQAALDLLVGETVKVEDVPNVKNYASPGRVLPADNDARRAFAASLATQRERAEKGTSKRRLGGARRKSGV